MPRDKSTAPSEYSSNVSTTQLWPTSQKIDTLQGLFLFVQGLILFAPDICLLPDSIHVNHVPRSWAQQHARLVVDPAVRATEAHGVEPEPLRRLKESAAALYPDQIRLAPTSASSPHPGAKPSSCSRSDWESRCSICSPKKISRTVFVSEDSTGQKNIPRVSSPSRACPRSLFQHSSHICRRLSSIFGNKYFHGLIDEQLTHRKYLMVVNLVT